MLILYEIIVMLFLLFLDSVYLKTYNNTIIKNKGIKQIFKFEKKEALYFIFAAIFLISMIFKLHIDYNNVFVTIRIITIALIAVITIKTDLKDYIIPNKIILIGLGLRLLTWIIEFSYFNIGFLEMLKNDFFGLLLGGGTLFIASLIAKNSVGMGDVKLMALLGLFCGFQGTFNIFFYTLLSCAVISIILLISKRKNRKDILPMAQFIGFGIFLYALIG